jgi:hypothetical protein
MHRIAGILTKFCLVLLACFIVFVILLVNIRQPTLVQMHTWAGERLPDGGYQLVGTAIYWMQKFAWYFGFDSRWQMYGRQSRENLTVRVVGGYRIGGEVVYRDLFLPYKLKARYSQYLNNDLTAFHQPPPVGFIPASQTLAIESDSEAVVPDLVLHPCVPSPESNPKIEKYVLNLLGEPSGLEAFSSYFARSFPTFRGHPLDSISIYLYAHPILPPSDARKLQSVYSPYVIVYILNSFKIGT